MSSEKIYHTQWSMNDISRYVDGDLTVDEIKRFEADLASDPFFKDAVDGYSGHARIYVDHHLQRLDEQFKGKSRKSIVPIWALGAAASLILLVSAWFLFGPSLMERNSSVSADNSTKEEIMQKSKQNQQSKKAMDIAEESENTDESVIDFDSQTVDGESQERAFNPAMSSQNRTAQTARPLGSARRRRAKKKTGSVVSGIVIDEAGQPVIGANIYFPSNEAAITSDFNGKFAVDLKSYDSIAIVNYSGFESGAFPLIDISTHKFRLHRSEPDLSEVVVNELPKTVSDADQIDMDAVSLEARSEKLNDGLQEEDAMSIQSSKALPTKGYKKYERYIRRNLNYPPAAISAGIEGKVVVEFKVLPNGDLFDVRVVQSLGHGCDAEAVRLIKEGPSWAVDNQSGVRQGSYVIEFELK